MAAGQVVVLALVVPCYGRMVEKFRRMKLINVVTAFRRVPGGVLRAGPV